MSNSLKITIVRNGNSIDTDATLAGVANDLAKLAASEQSSNETIAEAVATVWAANNVKAMKLDTLANEAVAFIPGVTTETRESVVLSVKEYVRGATDTMLIARGKHGGVQFLARLSAEELASVKAQVAKADAKRTAVAA